MQTSSALLHVKRELCLLRKWCPWQWRAPYVPGLLTRSLKALQPVQHPHPHHHLSSLSEDQQLQGKAGPQEIRSVTR